MGFIHFTSNFTNSFAVFRNWNEVDFTDDGRIQVFLDNSDLQITNFLQRNLYKAYRNFIESLMNDCGKTTRAGSIPMLVETFNGSIDDEFTHALVPGLLVA